MLDAIAVSQRILSSTPNHCPLTNFVFQDVKTLTKSLRSDVSWAQRIAGNPSGEANVSTSQILFSSWSATDK